ncbi:aldo/keto reductase [Thaumasiovibrio subtropicus]|uniref:aldo/keto reductase n=1 Tax=Thaumasiovibrio subtropicus TaxID=1891207 RepID=UPI000B35B248|nr:aldo/keto reductase [Thaumasiovibrio subtropicus]
MEIGLGTVGFGTAITAKPTIKDLSVELGNTGIKVSPLGFGTMLLGSSVSETQSFRLLDEYLALGGNFLDTANCYAYWVENGYPDASERVIGKWLASRNNRQDVIIATKCGCRPKNSDIIDEHPHSNMEGLAPETIYEGIERSLNNMGIDYVDLYYVHFDDRSQDLFQIMKTLDDLVKQGKTKAIACSNFMSWRFKEAQMIAKQHGFTPFCAIQQHLTYLNPKKRSDFGVCDYVTRDLENMLQHETAVSLVAYSPLLGGYYTRQDRRENYWRKHVYENTGNERRLEVLSRVADKYGVSENVIVLAWMCQRQPSALPLISASKVEQLRENFSALQIKLHEPDLQALEEA